MGFCEGDLRVAAKIRVPYKVIRNSNYRVEKYTGDNSDYFKVFRLLDEKHIATVYTESALEVFLTK